MNQSARVAVFFVAALFDNKNDRRAVYRFELAVLQSRGALDSEFFFSFSSLSESLNHQS